MKKLQTEIEIQAPADRVWQILTDFASFPQWNPFVIKAGGNLAAGEKLVVTLKPPGARGMTIRPTIVKADPDKELQWIGHLFMPGLFDGRHSFTIEPLGKDRVRFVQSEIFTGLIIPLFPRRLYVSTQCGFEEMNQALKARAEQTA